MNDSFFQAAALIVPLVLAIVCHEVAHGWVARALGDPTAQERGRLTLNPMKHVDPVGTLVLPGMLALTGAPVFGWAKPVPVNQWRLRNPRYGMMAVAAAGPATNLVLGATGAVLLGLLGATVGEEGLQFGAAGFVATNLLNFIVINIFLALFNLLPIPPFDGSHVVEGLLPRPAAAAYARLRKLGFALVFLLLIVLPWVFKGFDPVGAVVQPPVEWLLARYMSLATLIGG